MEGAARGGDVDDARGWGGGFEEREEGRHHEGDAGDVGLESGSEDFVDVGVVGGFGFADAGVVDEDVEAVVGGSDELFGGLDALFIRNVERDDVDLGRYSERSEA